MSLGMVIRDSSGREVVGPGTFTVRMVASRIVNAGVIPVGGQVDVFFGPTVRPGMLVQVAPMDSYPSDLNLQRSCAEVIADNGGRTFVWGFLIPSKAREPVSDAFRCLPRASIYDGGVTLHAHPFGVTSGNVMVYVLVHI